MACEADPPAFAPELIQPTAMTISAGAYHTCALRPNGFPVCWGWNDYGQASALFVHNPGFGSITAGGAHTCGLQLDGQWKCWGSYYHSPYFPHWTEAVGIYGGPSGAIPMEQEFPDRDDQFIAISSGLAHTCALRSNGEAECWGVSFTGAASPFEGEQLMAISSGRFHTCGLRLDDSPLCWSSLDWDRVDDKDKYAECLLLKEENFVECFDAERRFQCPPFDWVQEASGCSSRRALALTSSVPGLPPEGLKLRVISSGGSQTCGLRMDNSPVCWGGDREGGASPPEDERFAAISSGEYHTCALRLDGSPRCWGSNSFGQASAPKNDRFVAISSGAYHTCGLRVDGTAVCWGDDRHGQSSPPDVRFAVAFGEGS